MKKQLRLLFLVLVASEGVFGQASLDDFKCYFVPQPATIFPIQQILISLEDQFDTARNAVESVSDVRLTRFCTPVQKTEHRRTTGIIDDTHHLSLYHITPQPVIPRDVIVRNQFGHQKLTLGDAQALAVPTGRSASGQEPPSPPPNLDHFKCYAASGKRVGTILSLQDDLQATNVWVLDPISFCNPVMKTFDGTTTPIQNPQAHLTCYTITPKDFSGAVAIRNQFGTLFGLTLDKADILCVASLKLQWSDLSVMLDGRLD